MISRREAMTAGVLGTLAPSVPAETAVTQDAQALKEALKGLEDKVTDLKNTLERSALGSSMNYGSVGQVKLVIEKYTRTSGKFPDWCDIGLSVFYDIYDWHVRNQQQINITRIAEQRLAIQFMFTQLVLRWEQEPNYVGTPFDR